MIFVHSSHISEKGRQFLSFLGMTSFPSYDPKGLLGERQGGVRYMGDYIVEQKDILPNIFIFCNQSFNLLQYGNVKTKKLFG